MGVWCFSCSVYWLYFYSSYPWNCVPVIMVMELWWRLWMWGSIVSFRWKNISLYKSDLLRCSNFMLIWVYWNLFELCLSLLVYTWISCSTYNYNEYITQLELYIWNSRSVVIYSINSESTIVQIVSDWFKFFILNAAECPTKENIPESSKGLKFKPLSHQKQT